MQPVLANYLKALESKIHLKAAVLFGSTAREEADRWSDLDLCIIAEDLPTDFRERMDLLWAEKPPAFDVVGFRPSEMVDLIFRPMILDILLEGRVVAGDMENLRQRAQVHLEQEGLERTAFGYAKRQAA